MRIWMPSLSRAAVIAMTGLTLACTAAPQVADAASGAQEQPRRMSITGEGEVTGTPDMATVRMGVITEADTARAALDANTEAMNAVFATLDGLGIAKKDVQTSNFSVQPKYQPYDRSRPNAPRKIIGYMVSNMVGVRVRDLSKLGRVLDQAVTGGANQFQGLSFGFAEPGPMLDEARQQAVREAIRKAKLYTDAAGITLGRIMSIHESGGHRPPRPMLMRSASAEAADVPVAPGESTISAQVSIEFELE